MESFVATRFLQELVNKELKQEFICSSLPCYLSKIHKLGTPSADPISEMPFVFMRSLDET